MGQILCASGKPKDPLSKRLVLVRARLRVPDTKEYPPHLSALPNGVFYGSVANRAGFISGVLGKKMELTSNAELVRYALTHGLIS